MRKPQRAVDEKSFFDNGGRKNCCEMHKSTISFLPIFEKDLLGVTGREAGQECFSGDRVTTEKILLIPQFSHNKNSQNNRFPLRTPIHYALPSEKNFSKSNKSNCS